MNKEKIDRIKTNILKNLNILLDKSNLTQKELAKFANLPYSTVNNIFGQNNDNPRMSTLYSIAHVLGVKISNITGELPLSFVDTMVPLIKWNNLDILTKSIDFIKTDDSIYVACPFSTDNALYALKANKKVSNKYNDETILIFEYTQNFNNNDQVIVSINNSKPVIKEIFIDTGTIYLKSDFNNNDHFKYTADNATFFGIIRETRITNTPDPDY